MHGRLKSRPPDAARLRQREEHLRKYRESMRELRERRGGAVLELTASVLAANPDVATCWGLRREALLLEPEPDCPRVGAPPGAAPPRPPLRVDLHGAAPAPRLLQLLRMAPTAAAAAPRRGGRPPGGPSRRQILPFLGPFPRFLVHFPPFFGSNSALFGPFFLLLCQIPPFFDRIPPFLGQFPPFWGQIPPFLVHFRPFLPHFPPFCPLPPPFLDPFPPSVTPFPSLPELELIRNAAFTDPHDQSAWIYLRCLLSQALPPPRILSLYLHRDDPALAITFSRPIVAGPELEVVLDGAPVDGKWRSAEGGARSSRTWLLDLPPAPPASSLRLRVTWAPGPAPCELTLQSGEDEAWWQEPIAARELFWPEVGVSEAGLLRAQAQWCRELRELEPQSRGCLLVLALLLWALEPLEHEEEMRSCLQELKAADPMRRGFVSDAASRLEVAAALLRRGAGPEGELRLRGKALTSLPLLEHMVLVPALDLSHNGLGGLPGAMGALRRLKVLDVAHNNISSLKGFPPLPWLEEMGLEGNPLSHASALSPLAACPRLARLRLAGTPLAAAPGAAAHVGRLLPRADVSLGPAS
ncbi:geranylgeranyl transferase type-2 subunit alpha [Guaruba guarouba]